VKLQISLASSTPFESMLVYNEDRSLVYQGFSRDEVDFARRKLGEGCFKGYFEAERQADGKLDIGLRCGDQDW